MGVLLTLRKVAAVPVYQGTQVERGVTLLAELKVDARLPGNRGVALVSELKTAVSLVGRGDRVGGGVALSAGQKVAVSLVCQGDRVVGGVTVWAKEMVDALLAKNREETLLAELKGPNVLARKRRRGKNCRAANDEAARVG